MASLFEHQLILEENGSYLRKTYTVQYNSRHERGSWKGNCRSAKSIWQSKTSKLPCQKIFHNKKVIYWYGWSNPYLTLIIPRIVKSISFILKKQWFMEKKYSGTITIQKLFEWATHPRASVTFQYVYCALTFQYIYMCVCVHVYIHVYIYTHTHVYITHDYIDCTQKPREVFILTSFIHTEADHAMLEIILG